MKPENLLPDVDPECLGVEAFWAIMPVNKLVDGVIIQVYNAFIAEHIDGCLRCSRYRQTMAHHYAVLGLLDGEDL